MSEGEREGRWGWGMGKCMGEREGRWVPPGALVSDGGGATCVWVEVGREDGDECHMEHVLF